MSIHIPMYSGENLNRHTDSAAPATVLFSSLLYPTKDLVTLIDRPSCSYY